MRNGKNMKTMYIAGNNMKKMHGNGIRHTNGSGEILVGSWLRNRRLNSIIPSTFTTICITFCTLMFVILMLYSFRRTRSWSQCNPYRHENANGKMSVKYISIYNAMSRLELQNCLSFVYWYKCHQDINSVLQFCACEYTYVRKLYN